MRKLMSTIVGTVSLLSALTLGQQLVIQDDSAPRPEAFSVVSLLSLSPQHSMTLHLLQRAKLIPTLNMMQNATLFAPTDRAWEQWAERQGGEDASWLGAATLEEFQAEKEPSLNADLVSEELLDNQNWALRQHLLYHLLNYTLAPHDILPLIDNSTSVSNVSTHETLLFPYLKAPHPSPSPPSGPPWLPPSDTGKGLLGGSGQRLRLLRGSGPDADLARVAVDWRGEGGVSFWDGAGWENRTDRVETAKKGHRKEPEVQGVRWAGNGAVVGLDDVLDPPPSIEKLIRTLPKLAYLSTLLPNGSAPSPLPDLDSSPHLTLFAPTEQAFSDAFGGEERRYLESEYGVEAVGRVLGGAVVTGYGQDKKRVGWRDNWIRGMPKGVKVVNVTTASGDVLDVEVNDDETIKANGTSADEIDIFAANGVIHIIPSLLVPPHFKLLNTAERVLLSLNATRFVSLLRTANLSSTYVGNTHDSESDRPWTILAPADDVLEMRERKGWHVPEVFSYDSERGNTPLQDLLKYHVLPGRISPDDVENHMLLETELRTDLLRGARQKLPVHISSVAGVGLGRTVDEGELRFGEATVLARPIRSGQSIIYLISNLLSPPIDVLQTAVSDLQFSTFVAAVYAADLDNFVKRTPAVTYVVPRNKAFGQLGLAMKYLLLPEGKDELRKVIKHHALDQAVYLADVQDGKTVYSTLGGGKLVVGQEHAGNKTNITVRAPNFRQHHADLPDNGELRPAALQFGNVLTETGVMHVIDQVEMPSAVKITIEKLLMGAKAQTMADLMTKAGLGWVLDGREPSFNEVRAAGLEGTVASDGAHDDDLEAHAFPSYTLLCPTDVAFSRINLTAYLHEPPALLAMLKLHLIPSAHLDTLRSRASLNLPPPTDGQPLALSDAAVYPTLLSAESRYGDLAFRATGDHSYLIGIRNARGRSGRGDVARVGQQGRASVRWKPDTRALDFEGSQGTELWMGGMSLGGGVIMIDSVLIPYEPSWWVRWGWLVITLIGVALVLTGVGIAVGWWWMSRGQKDQYEALEGEED